MVELIETETGTVLARYSSLEVALTDVGEQIRIVGRNAARTWALGERQQDGRLVRIAAGEALANRAQGHVPRAAS